MTRDLPSHVKWTVSSAARAVQVVYQLYGNSLGHSSSFRYGYGRMVAGIRGIVKTSTISWSK